jgi:ATP-dependent helicase YprA (DUF1998 family)
MNPRETTEKIKQDYQDYIASILRVKDRQITALAHEKVRNTTFVKGPFLEITLPFNDGKSLKELAEEGLISKEFEKMGNDVHYEDWKLRVHQEESLRHIIKEERNMVVSTGTGSGKTECYLYPIFNSIMREKEAGTLDDGVRALLIFPMNALANDQQKKLRKLLKNYPDITFGRYTGETAHAGLKETSEQAEKRLHDEYDATHILDADISLRKSIPNELMCREHMAEKPPHILLTNYAMLEYMLLRPDTAPFFDNNTAKNWRFIVIDEAHTYKGASGTEIAYLLRRVKERIRHNMNSTFRCIATSATLGSNDPDAKAGMAAFASRLFDEPFSTDDIITTERKKRVMPRDGRNFMPEDYKRLKELVREKNDEEKGKILYDELVNDYRLFYVYDALSGKPKQIEDVASVVFDDIPDDREKESALINLIELAASAKKSESESALLPARYHLFVKSLEGMFAQYYPRKMVYFDRKEYVYEGNNSYAVFELSNCQKCGQEYLVGKKVEGKCGEYFTQTSSTEKPDFYFISNDESEYYNGFDEDDSIEESEKMDELEKYHLCLCCGRITPFAERAVMDCCSNPDAKKIVKVYNLNYTGKNGESNCCPCCGATRKGLIKRFLTANQPATFAVAKSLYEAIPPRKNNTKISNDDIFDDDLFDDNIFDDDYLENNEANMDSGIADESGRKLLIFSDNRQEAAFFAGFFDKKYSLLMWRKVILQALKKAPNNTLCVEDLIKKVRNEADKAGLYTLDMERNAAMTDNQKLEMAGHYVMQEFISPDIQTGLEGLGYIEIFPEPAKLKESIEIAGVNGNNLWNLFRYMMDTLRQKGVVTYPEGIYATDDFFAPRNHVRYFRQQGSHIGINEYIYGFIPQDKTPNKRLGLMLKFQTNEEEARQDLRSIFKLILQLGMKRKYINETTDSERGTVYCLNHAKWNFRLVNNDDKLFRCNKCGKTFGYSIKGLCPEMRCNGRLVEVSGADVHDEPYYNNIYKDSKLIPMVAREHTAQLTSKTAGEYQKDFEDGKINVLSCSTTFEMGVDVGELEATFQRNVPPETSNYIQRAGRAGRRTSSAAFSVTFSRRTSHDMTFFQEPTKIIAGKIKSPVLEVDNEKIAERHLNSVIIAWFFKHYPDYFKGGTGRVVSYGSEVNMATDLYKSLQNKPESLLQSIHDVLPNHVCEALGVDNWNFIENLVGKEGSLTIAIENRLADIGGLREFCAEVFNQGNDGISSKEIGRAMAAKKLIETLESESSISFLSSNGVLPKYGFPIDTVNLDILSGDNEEAKKIELSRDLKMAISEFAPPSQVVANGKVWKSYAINTVPNKSWPAYIYYECPSCKKIYPPEDRIVDATISINGMHGKKCSICDTLTNPRKFIVPLFGFSTKMGDKPNMVGDSKPSTYYATQTQFWGIENLTEMQKAKAKKRDIQLSGKSIDITYSPGGKLFVLNQGINGRGIKICPSCGFATDVNNVLKNGKHETKYKRNCGNKSFINASLGHYFSTDILKIKLPLHDINIQMPEGVTPKDQGLSILYAILEGASVALDISRDDISGCVSGDGDLILFDNTAGGSGFVKYIYENFEKVLRSARNKVSGICECTEETSCYGCLRNYSNQFHHDLLSRGLALHYIEWLLDEEYKTDVKPTKESDEPEELVSIGLGKEPKGIILSNYDVDDASTYCDTRTVLEDLENTTDDENLKNVYQRLLEAIGTIKTENPITMNKIDVEVSIWPEIFWGKSHVALFVPGEEKQFNILKKYDWYCYMLDEKLDAQRVISHIKVGGDY